MTKFKSFIFILILFLSVNTSVFGNKNSGIDLASIRTVYVELHGKSIAAKILAKAVHAKGRCYVGLINLGQSSYKLIFLDSSKIRRFSTICLDKDKHGSGFCAGSMPKRLFLHSVNFRVLKNGNIEGLGKSQIFLRSQGDADNNSIADKFYSAEVLSGYCDAKNFNIIIKLNLPLDFNLIIKEIKDEK